MNFNKYIARQQPLPGLIGQEKVMMVYNLFTLAMAVVFYHEIAAGPAPILSRLAIIAFTVVLWRLYRNFPCDLTYVLRVYFQVALLSFWYPDIYNFAKLMPNVDPFFAHADQLIFGCQPALVFHQVLHGAFWSELFYMGYFSYYLMIVVTVVFATFCAYRHFDRTTTVILSSFAMYYVVFLFLQAGGPQFYYPKIGVDAASAGVFPSIGDWFRLHPELNYDNGIHSGFFYSLVEKLQGSEFPIAAFPSSHVGLATVLMLLARKMSKVLLLFFLPFYVVLCLSTVYIGAHYGVDVIAGWGSALLFYALSLRIYRSRYVHRPRA